MNVKNQEENVSQSLSYSSLGTSWNGIWLVAISGSIYIVIDVKNENYNIRILSEKV